jgi:hypothetical protein
MIAGTSAIQTDRAGNHPHGLVPVHGGESDRLRVRQKVNNSIREVAIRNSASVPTIGTLAQVRVAYEDLQTATKRRTQDFDVLSKRH